ncbi:MAG TPA: lipopolysaccharide assembly protein LapA domain-containing protein [Mycobacterium sp.]|jgi:uncharacterized integral membrane protein|uniref:LapA family protein n=1 Tax=Mycobacterium sp. TaxID=1785 RepID=UPI002D60E5FB|nr:lipopolysaccharide assembly protein LapA domain-containing protein [Mycobacterium sp.]HZU46684.1 lipopolysaccharide assembly protein LapA domain-containing protein [Mycobacterium sp.]
MSSDRPASPEQPHPTTPAAGQVPAAPSTPESVRFTRAAALWAALAVGMLILIILLIFIAQNTASAQFAFLGWRWTLPLGVAILFAAVCGGLITVLVGTGRIYQLRRAAKRDLMTRR